MAPARRCHLGRHRPAGRLPWPAGEARGWGRAVHVTPYGTGGDFDRREGLPWSSRTSPSSPGGCCSRGS